MKCQTVVTTGAAPLLSAAHAGATGAGETSATGSVTRRLRGAAIAIPCFAVLAVGAWLSPDSRGFGTHEQLGLPPCGFMLRTGWPCPSCGLTTSVTDLTHGQVVAAFWANPFGIVLSVGLAIFGVFGAAELISGKDLIRKLRPGMWWLWATVGAFLAGWGFELARKSLGG